MFSILPNTPINPSPIYSPPTFPLLPNPRFSRNRHFLAFNCLQSCETSPEFSTSQSIPKSHSIIKRREKDKFTVHYLMNSCGLSQSEAISASKKVGLETQENPDIVLTLFKNYGLTKTQISDIVKNWPNSLSCKLDTLLPKLEFFKSIGVSTTDLARDPHLFLTRSLEECILPSYNYLKSMHLSDEKIIHVLRRTLRTSKKRYSKNFVRNIEFLKQLELPEPKLILAIAHYPEAVMEEPDQFKKAALKALEMGFDRSKSHFIQAVDALLGEYNKATWDQCYDTYTKWGWSEKDILCAFKCYPFCMLISEKKICRVLEFLVKEMGFESSYFAKNPELLNYSLEKRIIPRCSVIKVLLSKGVLVKEYVHLTSVLIPVEKRFLAQFVNKYVEQVPELLQVYKEKLESAGNAEGAKGIVGLRMGHNGWGKLGQKKGLREAAAL